MIKILKFFKYEFRYKLSSTYIILGMMIGFLSLFNGIGIYQYIKSYTNDLRGNQYEYSKRMQLVSLNPFNIKDYTYEVMGILRMDYVDVLLNDENQRCIITILLETKEDTNYHMVSGRLPNDEERFNGEKVVAVGRGREDAVYYVDDIPYILIESEEYRVTGIIGTKSSEAQDYLLVTYYECLGDGVIECIDPYGCELVFESNINDVTYDSDGVASLAAVDDIEISIGQADKNISGMTLEQKNSMNMYILLFGFTIISSVMIARFWIFQRKRDIAILRISGYSKFKILFRQIEEMLFHIFCACIISGIIQCIIHMCMNNWNDYQISLTTISGTIMVIILISVGIVISPTLEVLKNSPVNEIRGN